MRLATFPRVRAAELTNPEAKTLAAWGVAPGHVGGLITLMEQLNTSCPGSLLKLLLRKSRTSPPNLKEWRERTQLSVSARTKVVSPRPCGKFLSSPNSAPMSPMLMVGMNRWLGPSRPDRASVLG